MRSSTVAFIALFALSFPMLAAAQSGEHSGGFLRSFLDRTMPGSTQTPKPEPKAVVKPEPASKPEPSISGPTKKGQDARRPGAPLLQPTEAPRASRTVTVEEPATVPGAIALPAGAAKAYGADVLTPDQIAACVETAQLLDETAKDLEAEGARLGEFAAKVKQENADIATLRADVSARDAAAVSRYNDRAAALNALEGAYRERFQSWSTQEQRLEQKFADYNGACTKRFYPDDMQAVLTRMGISR
jgi:hypothetical protein